MRLLKSLLVALFETREEVEEAQGEVDLVSQLLNAPQHPLIMKQARLHLRATLMKLKLRNLKNNYHLLSLSQQDLSPPSLNPQS